MSGAPFAFPPNAPPGFGTRGQADARYVQLTPAAEASQTIAGPISIRRSDDGATALLGLDLDRLSTTPAAADELSSLTFSFRSSTGVKRTAAGFTARAVAVTNAAENGALDIDMIVNGTMRKPWKFAATGANPTSTLTWGTGTTMQMYFDQAVTDGFGMNLSSTAAAAGFLLRNATNVIAHIKNLAAGHGQIQLVPGLATPAGGLAGAGITYGSSFIADFFGSGAPTAVNPQGSTYRRSDGSSTITRGYIATDGAGTYTPITTVA